MQVSSYKSKEGGIGGSYGDFQSAGQSSITQLEKLSVCYLLHFSLKEQERGRGEERREDIKGSSLSIFLQLYLIVDKIDPLGRSHLNFNACELGCFIVISVLMYDSHLHKS